MTKIVQAVNTMLQHPERITKVLVSDFTGEYYFLYNKYVWSILYNSAENRYSLYFYPGTATIEELADARPDEPQGQECIHYSTKELGTKEAYSTFQELYKVVQEKLFKVDKVLEEIINEDKF